MEEGIEDNVGVPLLVLAMDGGWVGDGRGDGGAGWGAAVWGFTNLTPMSSAQVSSVLLATWLVRLAIDLFGATVDDSSANFLADTLVTSSRDIQVFDIVVNNSREFLRTLFPVAKPEASMEPLSMPPVSADSANPIRIVTSTIVNEEKLEQEWHVMVFPI